MERCGNKKTIRSFLPHHFSRRMIFSLRAALDQDICDRNTLFYFQDDSLHSGETKGVVSVESGSNEDICLEYNDIDTPYDTRF